MNTTRFVLAFLAAFIFIFCWGLLYNGVLMHNAHAEVMNLFRPRAETMGLFYWIVLGQAVIGLAFCADLRQRVRRWRNRRRNPTWKHARTTGERR